MLVWWAVPGYEGYYEVSSGGQVRALARVLHGLFYRGQQRVLPGRLLSPRPNRYGYFQVSLSRDGKVSTFTLHRLVATAFIENPRQLPQINHKNNDKHDNRVENLEWVTAAKNMEHSFGLPVLCENTGAVYASPRSAAQALGLSVHAVRNCLRGAQKQSRGYSFRRA
jgi:uncharacterized OB-fold protein